MVLFPIVYAHSSVMQQLHRSILNAFCTGQVSHATLVSDLHHVIVGILKKLLMTCNGLWGNLMPSSVKMDGHVCCLATCMLGRCRVFSFGLAKEGPNALQLEDLSCLGAEHLKS